MKRTSFFLLLAAVIPAASATTLNYLQCAGTDAACIAPIQSQNGQNPGQLLATADATVIDGDGGARLNVGTIRSAAYTSAAGLEIFYQLALNASFPKGASAFEVISVDSQELINTPINVYGRSDSLASYGAAQFTASDIIATKIQNLGASKFALAATFSPDNPLLPGETSAVLGVTASNWDGFKTDAIGATFTVPLSEGDGGHGYILQGNLLVGSEAPEPSTNAILALGLGLLGAACARRKRTAKEK